MSKLADELRAVTTFTANINVTRTAHEAADVLDDCTKLIADLAQSSIGGYGQVLGLKYGRDDARDLLTKLEAAR